MKQLILHHLRVEILKEGGADIPHTELEALLPNLYNFQL